MLHGAIQIAFFAIGQWPRGALREIAQPQRPDGHAKQPQHLHAQLRQHAADVAILSLVEHDFEPAIFVATAQNAGTLCPQENAIFGSDSGGYGCEQSCVRNRSNLHVIGFIEMSSPAQARVPPTRNHWSEATGLRWPCPNGRRARATAYFHPDRRIPSRVPFRRKPSSLRHEVC